MRTTAVLQLLVGLCCLAAPAAQIPTSQLEMLALGLAHLLRGAEDDVRSVEGQGDLVVKELNVATRNLESLRRQSSQAGRTHRQVLIDNQARRLVSLTAEVSAQDRIVDRRLRQVERLEKSVIRCLRASQHRLHQLSSAASTK